MKTSLAIFITCSALMVSGCSGLLNGKAAGEAAITRFHELYNAGKLDDIWQEAHEKFQAASKKENFTRLMNEVQRQLGQVTSSANTGLKLNSINLTTTVLMTQKTVFAQGEGTETFTFQMDGKQALLVGYNIQSLNLIAK